MSIITTGVQGGSLATRQEIRTMMQDQELFTLYLLALERMQKVDESDPSSWFQIAGIHGRPVRFLRVGFQIIHKLNSIFHGTLLLILPLEVYPVLLVVTAPIVPSCSLPGRSLFRLVPVSLEPIL